VQNANIDTFQKFDSRIDNNNDRATTNFEDLNNLTVLLQQSMNNAEAAIEDMQKSDAETVSHLDLFLEDPKEMEKLAPKNPIKEMRKF